MYEARNYHIACHGVPVSFSRSAEHRKRGDRVLVGFDFIFGYPAGTAERLKLTGTPWQAMW